ncbi:MAG: acetyl-CoA carboxylase, carboxyltransferase subunit beta [Peptoniphilaceae bacterium]|uniref:acetyl-CoA carboxylase, carboxyltransferase subunit beta n=1 Tax=Parvimonas sp. TaxID=1944660 RepID=UPI0025FE9F17|nr:acetyl-CoA carboxylase, carboxyltransferase subunit beta [Parvimonas sp.]MCI5997187.1 acetyl-CoA carboxylase, carboxyltransferase subunit beta [Parvimonas sp.]MDD7764280.1 acetyl-CoA carboxylase, carboxyltransferase subunit beta [Peptoniphilaceae bacterium]MDY3051543.1 acetyl-CoA carboxylase, carboxyltransferase subunit beta [Parvimonas sp.]
MQNLFSRRKNEISKLKIYRKNYNTFIVREIPDNLFKPCPVCSESISCEQWEENLYVCNKCGHHLRIGAKQRIKILCDINSFDEFDAEIRSENEESFYQYDEKLEKAMFNSKLNEAVVCGVGEISGILTVVCVMDSNFMMGSMGKVVGEKITRSIEYATHKKLPLVIVTASGGARMQEGIISLMQMAKTSAALKKHSEKGLLYVSVLTDPTMGGVSASFAMLADIIIAEPNSLIGFAGRRVIEKTINENLPDEFQKSEFLLKKGFVDTIIKRSKLKDTIHKLLILHGVK